MEKTIEDLWVVGQIEAEGIEEKDSVLKNFCEEAKPDNAEEEKDWIKIGKGKIKDTGKNTKSAVQPGCSAKRGLRLGGVGPDLLKATLQEGCRGKPCSRAVVDTAAKAKCIGREIRKPHLEETADEELTINQVCKNGWARDGKKMEVTVDSAADESVCPKEWGEDMFQLKEVAEGKEMKLRNANGGKIMHYGKRDVTFEVEGEFDVKLMGLGFQASDVRKPLAAAHRIVEKGNWVQFGPKPEDNFIQNVKTLEKVHMRKKGRSYVLDIEFVKKATDSTTFQRQP